MYLFIADGRHPRSDGTRQAPSAKPRPPLTRSRSVSIVVFDIYAPTQQTLSAVKSALTQRIAGFVETRKIPCKEVNIDKKCEAKINQMETDGIRIDIGTS